MLILEKHKDGLELFQLQHFTPTQMSAEVSCLLRTKRNWVILFQAQGELSDLLNLSGDSGGSRMADGLFWFWGESFPSHVTLVSV